MTDLASRLESTRGRRLLVWAVALLPVAAALAPRDLWAPEEPKFGRIAHEMATEGDWLVTRINGRVDAEKPPLLHWGIAAVETVVGRPTATGARIPAALLALLGVLATRRLVRRWFDDAALADDAAILFGTTLALLWNGPRVGMDAGLAAFAAIGLEGATAAVVEGSVAGVLRLAAAIGLGMLLKGPHALYVPVAGAVGGALAVRRGGGLRLAAGTALGLALFAAWLVPALLLRGDEVVASGVTFRERVLGQVASRVSGANEPHRHGPFYMVPMLLLFAMPWTPMAASGAVLAVRRRATDVRERFGLSAALWGVGVPLLLLSVAASKRETYVVPLMPCVAALAAYGLHRGGDERWLRAGAAGAGGGLLVAGVGLLLAPWVAPHVVPPDPADAVSSADLRRWPLVATLGVAGVVSAAAGAWVLSARRLPVVASRRAGAALVVLAVVLHLGVLAAFDANKSLAEAVAVARREAPGARLVVAGTASANALWAFGVDRYERVDDHATLARALAPDAPRAVALIKDKFWVERAKRDPASAPALDRARVLWGRRVEGSRWFLVTNAPH